VTSLRIHNSWSAYEQRVQREFEVFEEVPQRIANINTSLNEQVPYPNSRSNVYGDELIAYSLTGITKIDCLPYFLFGKPQFDNIKASCFFKNVQWLSVLDF